MTERAVRGLAYEDLVPGWRRTFPPRAISREEITRFAREWDPQSFHLDEEAARRTHFGGLVASGWHTACLIMRIVVDGLLEGSTSMGSPGIEDLRWLRPVRPDDPLTLTLEVVEARPSRSKPDRGSVKFGYVLVNGAGEPVLTMAAWVMFGRRATAPGERGGTG
jgi:acyl dehydratase